MNRVLMMFLLFMFSTVRAEYSDTVCWRYDVTDGEVAVDVPDVAGAVVIPKELGGCPVTKIRGYGLRFESCKLPTSVTIPSSVRKIDLRAFNYCESLVSFHVDERNSMYCSEDGILYSKDKSELLICPMGKTGCVKVPMGVRIVGGSAFSGCRSITAVKLPSSVVSIRGYAFSRCSALSDVEFPLGLTTVDDSAFQYCEAIAKIIIPSKVKVVGDNAFHGCKSLSTVILSPGVRSIGNWAFYMCDALTSVTIPQSVENIGEFSFSGCNALSSMTIPQGVKTIGEFAFGNCKLLTSVIIPASVASIGESAFAGCCSLLSIQVVAGSESYSAFDGVLYDKDRRELVFCPQGRKGAVLLPADVITIRKEAFQGCKSITAVTIPPSVKVIGEKAFSGCKSLDLLIPPSIPEVGKNAFEGCRSTRLNREFSRLFGVNFKDKKPEQSISTYNIGDIPAYDFIPRKRFLDFDRYDVMYDFKNEAFFIRAMKRCATTDQAEKLMMKARSAIERKFGGPMTPVGGMYLLAFKDSKFIGLGVDQSGVVTVSGVDPVALEATKEEMRKHPELDDSL